MINTDDRPLEERPERLNAHNVNVPVNERLRVANDRMMTIANGLNITPEFISYKQVGIKTDIGIE